MKKNTFNFIWYYVITVLKRLKSNLIDTAEALNTVRMMLQLKNTSINNSCADFHIYMNTRDHNLKKFTTS